MVSFLHRQLENYQQQDDHKELLHFALLFLAEALVNGHRFVAPVDYSRLHWMVKLIYC